MATKNTTTKASKAKSSKKKKKGGKFATILTVMVVIAAIAWYVCGKPAISMQEGSFDFAVYLTEEPLWKRFINDPKAVLAEETGIDLSWKEESTQKSSPSATVSTGSSANNITEHDLNHPENSGLFLGNPSDAIASTSSPENYLMEKPQFTISYNNEKYIPNWVAWHLQSSDIGEADREDDFRPDDELPDGWYGIKKADYQYPKYGFDRGHVCPSADRTASQEDNSMTFLMTNMVPQAPDSNRVVWRLLEEYERDLALEGNELYIIAGVYGVGGSSEKGSFDSVEVKLKGGEIINMEVPAYTWKVLVCFPEGSGDLDRVSSEATVIAVMIPNQDNVHKDATWETYKTTIDEIEAATGYDFFELLPDNIEDVLEARAS